MNKKDSQITKVNQFILNPVMLPRKHQQSWMIRPNNATLVVNPTENDIQNVYSFCQQFRNYLTDFVYTSMSIPKLIKFNEPLTIVDNVQTLTMVIEILKEQKFIFIDVVNQTRTSYKGYISWILLATHNQLYVIDSAKLHDKCYELKQILMRNGLIKFMHDCEEVLFAMKRDFEIFMPNVFDLQVVQRYLNKKGKNNFQPKTAFKEFLSSIPSSIITLRPIKPLLLSKIQQFYQNQMTIMSQTDKFFSTQDPQYQCYTYYNHYELLLKSYFHHIPSVQQIDQLHKIKQGVSQNVFLQYNEHQQVNLRKQIKKQNQFWIKDTEEEQVAGMLCEWREHIAKMRDINVEEVLPYEKLSTLAKTKVNSILQISQICSNQRHKIGVYSLSLDQFQQIFELFQLYKQEKQEKAHELVIPRRMPFYKSNQQKPIKELFQELNFSDASNDWLNKKNDQSVKLYKEIVSINQFDNSIVQEYLKQMTHQKSASSHLNIEDINRYIKYAQYLRNGNHKKLQELYQRTMKNGKNKNTNDQQFQENFIQGEQYQNWDEIQNELNIPTMDSINLIPSIGSFKSINNIDVHSCGNLVNMKSPNILKEKKLNSLHQLQSPCIFNKIEPLPQNIEAIYLEAAKAKKNYTAKGQKKSNKTNKKQSKTSLDKNSKKQEEFIPKKEEIFNLIYY